MFSQRWDSCALTDTLVIIITLWSSNFYFLEQSLLMSFIMTCMFWFHSFLSPLPSFPCALLPSGWFPLFPLTYSMLLFFYGESIITSTFHHPWYLVLPSLHLITCRHIRKRTHRNWILNLVPYKRDFVCRLSFRVWLFHLTQWIFKPCSMLVRVLNTGVIYDC